MPSDSKLIMVTRKVLIQHGNNITKVKKLYKTVKRFLKREKLTDCEKGDIKRLYDEYKANSKLIATSSTVENSRVTPPSVDVSTFTGSSLWLTKSKTKSVLSARAQSSDILTNPSNPPPDQETPNPKINLGLELAHEVEHGVITKQRLSDFQDLQLGKKSSKNILDTTNQNQRSSRKVDFNKPEPLVEEERVKLVEQEQVNRLKPIKNFPRHKSPPGKPQPVIGGSLKDTQPERFVRKPPKRNTKASKTQFRNIQPRASGITPKRRLSNQESHKDSPHTKRIKNYYPNSELSDRRRNTHDRLDHRHKMQSRSYSPLSTRRAHTYKNSKNYIGDRPSYKITNNPSREKSDKRSSIGEKEQNILPWSQDNSHSRPNLPQSPVQNSSQHSSQRRKNEIMPERNKRSRSKEHQDIHSGVTQRQVKSMSSLAQDRDMTAKREILRHAIGSFVHKFENNIQSRRLQKEYLASLCSEEFLNSLHKLHDLLRIHGLVKVDLDQAKYRSSDGKG